MFWWRSEDRRIPAAVGNDERVHHGLSGRGILEPSGTANAGTGADVGVGHEVNALDLGGIDPDSRSVGVVLPIPPDDDVILTALRPVRNLMADNSPRCHFTGQTGHGAVMLLCEAARPDEPATWRQKRLDQQETNPFRHGPPSLDR